MKEEVRMKLLPVLFAAVVLGCSGRTPPPEQPSPAVVPEPVADPDLEMVLDTAEEYVMQVVDAMDAACGTLPPEAAEACRHAVVRKWLPRMRAILELRRKSGIKKRPGPGLSGPYAEQHPAGGLNPALSDEGRAF